MHSIDRNIDHENLAGFSWDKEPMTAHGCFQPQPIVLKKHTSALRTNTPEVQNLKIFNVFLLITDNQTQEAKPSALASKSLPSVSLKLPLESSINDAIQKLLSKFESLLKQQNQLFSLAEDTDLWEIRVAKKTGYPKDYIPAIDHSNLLKSVEYYDSLVLCPLNQTICFQAHNKSILSCSTQDNSKGGSPHIENSESLKATRIGSLSCGQSDKQIRMSLKDSLNHYSTNGFAVNAKNGGNNGKKEIPQPDDQVIKHPASAGIKIKKVNRFLSFFGC